MEAMIVIPPGCSNRTRFFDNDMIKALLLQTSRRGKTRNARSNDQYVCFFHSSDLLLKLEETSLHKFALTLERRK
jgi:hypothetical protein